MRRDGDEGAAEIWALADLVETFVTTDVARAVLDMNREEGDLGPDGIVKTISCFDEPVWREPLTERDVERLVVEHHRPYHARLTAGASDARHVLAIDGHTMAAVGPPVAKDRGRTRPTVCLSNADGTCPQEWIERMAEGFRDELPGHDVRINDPFRGGAITRRHGREMPWIQVEFSRAPAPAELHDVVRAVLTRWCERGAS